MIVPQPGTDQIIFPQVVEILTLLESVSRVTFCCQCYLPGSACRCLGSSSTTSTASTMGLSWSEVVNPTYSPNTASAGRGAGTTPPYGSSARAGGSIWDPSSMDFPGLPGAPSTSRQPHHPAGRAAFLERQLKAIHKGKTPDLLRLPQPTWDLPTTQNRRWVQLPPPCLSLIQVQRLTRVSRQRPRIQSLGDKKPSDLGEPGHVAVIVDPGRYLISHTPPNQPRDVLVEGLNLNSGRLLTGTRWPSLQPTIAGVGKKTWTFIWGPISGSTTSRSRPPSGQN